MAIRRKKHETRLEYVVRKIRGRKTMMQRAREKAECDRERSQDRRHPSR